MTGDPSIDAELIDAGDRILRFAFFALPLIALPAILGIAWRIMRGMLDYAPPVGNSHRSASTSTAVVPGPGVRLNETSPGISLNKSPEPTPAPWTFSEFDGRHHFHHPGTHSHDTGDSGSSMGGDN